MNTQTQTMNCRRSLRRLCVIATLAGSLSLAMTGEAAADPGQGCTFGDEPPGRVISGFVGRDTPHPGENLGGGGLTYAPVVATACGTNPPTPPRSSES